MLVHAAGESSPGNLSEGTYAIVLQVPDEAALIQLLLRLQRQGVHVTPIHEPDPPYLGQLMAIGVRPAKRSEIARFLSDLPLLKDSSGSSKRGPRESVTRV
jgi:hypothetical protein